MKLLRFDKKQGRPIAAYDSTGATVVDLLQDVQFFVVTIYLEPDGVLGMHPAEADQLFLVVAGSGQAFAGEQRCELSAGTAVLWKQGEHHETRAGKEGLTAIVLEGHGLDQALAANRRS